MKNLKGRGYEVLWRKVVENKSDKENETRTRRKKRMTADIFVETSVGNLHHAPSPSHCHELTRDDMVFPFSQASIGSSTSLLVLYFQLFHFMSFAHSFPPTA